jgi:hypothetical protein
MQKRFVNRRWYRTFGVFERNTPMSYLTQLALLAVLNEGTQLTSLELVQRTALEGDVVRAGLVALLESKQVVQLTRRDEVKVFAKA